MVGGNEATIVGSYSTGRATGVGSTGGLVGDNSGIILSSYWDKQASGNLTSVGGAGLTTAQMQDLSNFQTTYAGFDFQNVWSPPNQAGQGGQVSANYPKLYALTPVVWSDVNNSNRTYGASNPVFSQAGTYGGPSKYVFGSIGDAVTVPSTFTTVADAYSNVGIYNISTTNSSTSLNGIVYRIITTPLSITPATLTYLARIIHD